jgi:hypothetical protein
LEARRDLKPERCLKVRQNPAGHRTLGRPSRPTDANAALRPLSDGEAAGWPGWLGGQGG